MEVETAGGRAIVCAFASGGAKTDADLQRSMGAVWRPPMKGSTKRAIDWLTLPLLGYAIAAALWFHYTADDHPALFWRVLLMFDIPFAGAAIIWLGWRCLGSLPPLSESTKRVIDWLTVPVLAYIPASFIWAYSTGLGSTHPPKIWLVFLFIDVPFAFASMLWLASRADEIKVVYWFYKYIGMYPFRRFLFAMIFLSCLLAVAHLLKWLDS
jgi:hypothetical protein